MIAGTTDQGLFQDQRDDMDGYRFDVPNGTYQVDLHFAELQRDTVDRRRFEVSIEGDQVLPNLDVFDEAGGRYVALTRTFVVTVEDGHLDIGFDELDGHPIINAILVTGLPEGAPGT